MEHRRTALWKLRLATATQGIAHERYAPACIKLLAQYKSLMKLVGDDIGGVETFMKRFKVGWNSAV